VIFFYNTVVVRCVEITWKRW